MTVENIKAAFVGERFERLGEADDSLRGPEHQKPVFGHLPGDPIEDGDLGLLVEIDQHVAAEDDIEIAQHRKIVKQVKRTELNHAAQFGRESPGFADLIEKFHQ